MKELIKDKEAITAMREGGSILNRILISLESEVKVGIKTIDLDNFANELCKEYEVTPAFLNYKPGLGRPYPASLCISINDQVVHGLPGNTVLKEGDIVTLDFGITYKGYITDSAVTVPIGEVGKEKEDLLKITKAALYLAIDEVREGARVGDLGEKVQKYVEKQGCNIFESLAGHGVGKKLHEEPTIPNFGQKGTGMVLKEGMTLALETMVTTGLGEINMDSDGWTLKTADGSPAAQFEHTVLVLKDGCEILT